MKHRTIEIPDAHRRPPAWGRMTYSEQIEHAARVRRFYSPLYPDTPVDPELRNYAEIMDVLRMHQPPFLIAGARREAAGG